MDVLGGLRFDWPEALFLIVVLVPLAIYVSRTSIALLRPVRRRLSLALRITLIILLVLALSGPSIEAASNRLAVIFLLDHSDSVSPQVQAEEASYVRQAVGALGPNDSAGVVVFGADALVDRPVVPDTTLPDLASTPIRTYTNIESAIRLGLAMAPAGAARRLVLLSDGRENAGNAEEAARLAAANGAVLDVVPLPSQSGPEVQIDALTAPSPVRENERITLQAAVSSSVETTATLLLSVDGDPVASQQVSLARGTNTFVQTLPPASAGFHTYSAQVIPAPGSDTRTENNRYSAFSLVLGKPSLLVVEGHAGEAGDLTNALRASSNLTVVPPANMPADVKTLASYRGVVLVNVPGSSLSKGAMSALQQSVRDLGQGLIVVGGDESYAAGGYFRTALEAMLPVDLNLPARVDIPSVGMVLVIDRSGSMSQAHGKSGQGVPKIELAKEAAYQAVVQLSGRDYVGVVTFDSAASWAVDLQRMGDPEQLRSRIGGIMPGGGTNIYAGLAPAVDALVKSNARSKHIVLLTDGVSEGGDYESLIKKMADNGITLSAVAIGADADTKLLQTLAAAGKGRYYYTEDGNALPQIFAHESHLAARSYIIEHHFSPARTSPSPILDGLGALPPLKGYVGTSSRPGGQLVLVTDVGDPLLAQWQYGLGRVVAWTSDAKGQWAADWVSWPDFAQFWAQAVRWSTGAEGASALEPRVSLEAGTAHLTVDAGLPDGSFLNNLSMDAVVVGPDLLTSPVQLRQTGAGQYEARFPATQEGAYLLRVQTEGEGVAPMATSLGVVVPYSPEYRNDSAAPDVLGRLANLGGGRVLSLSDPTAALAHNLPTARSAVTLWPVLLLLSILLLPFDIGVRRVALTGSDLARAWNERGERLRRGRRVQPAVASGPSTPGIAALVQAKARGQERFATSVAERRSPRGGDADTPERARDLQTRIPAGRESPTASVGSPDDAHAEEAVGDRHTLNEETLAARLRRSREGRR